MRYWINKLWCALIFFGLLTFCFPSQVTAQNDATLRVLVTSGEDGTPIVGSNVVLLSYEPREDGEYSMIDGGVTDNDGFVEIREIDPGQYRLRVSYIGHQTYQEPITLEQGETRVEQISLPIDIEQLDELVIESEREITTGEVGVRRISSTDLGRIPTPGPSGDLASYLQTIPGVISSGDRGGDLYIRGGTPTQNKVLVDNLPVIKPFHISNLFSAFPEESVGNVDMFAGGFGAKYLGATSAVIDVTLKPGNMKEFSSAASMAPHLLSLQMEGPIETDQESFMFMGRKSMIEQTAPYLSSREVPIDFYDLTARYSYQSDDFYCNITAMRTYDQGEINPSRDILLSWSNTAIGGRCRGFDERYDHPFVITAGYSGYQNAEKSATHTERSAGFSKAYIKIDHEEEFLGLNFDYGFGVKFRTVSAELAERFTNFESFENFNIVPHAYFTTVLEPNEEFTIRPGFATQIVPGSYPTYEPRLRIAYQPDRTNNQEISIALGRYTQEIDGITDERDAGTVFTLWRPNEREHELQNALHGILGYQQRFGNYLKTNLEGYVKTHQNIPVSKWTPEARLEIETSLANGFTYGFDVRLEYDRSPLYLNLGYGWSKVEYEAVSGDLGAWIEEPIFSYSPAHDQRHKFNAIANYSLAEFTVNVGWEFGSGKPFTQVYGFDLALNSPSDDPLTDPGIARTLYSRPYNERLPVYHRLDASVNRSFEFSSNFSLEAKIGCINIYDRDNIFYFDLNSLERVDQTPLLPYVSLRTNLN